MNSLYYCKNFFGKFSTRLFQFALCFFFNIAEMNGQDGSGHVVVYPDTAIVGIRGEWLVKYIVTSDSLVKGGGIKVRFVKGFSAPQSTNPDSHGYVFTWTSASSVKSEIHSISRTDSMLPWQWERNVWNVNVRITNGLLLRGDTIYLQYGKFPNSMILPPYSVFEDSVLVASDTDADGVYREIGISPTIKVRPRRPYRIGVIAPSQAVLGVPIEISIICYDVFYNRQPHFRGTVTLSSTDSLVSMLNSFTFTAKDSGVKNLSVIFNSLGIQRLGASVSGATPTELWNVTSNPVVVYESEPQYKIYWGDLHGHTAISHDAYGTHSYEYASKIARLDFCALIDHCSNDFRTGDYRSDGITDKEWAFIKQQVIDYHKPGKFVTILGYEFSSPTPSGHHNVYFDADDNIIPQIPIFRLWKFRTTFNLWDALDTQLPPGVTALTVPHHTGVIWATGRGDASVNFERSYANDKYRSLTEIYSTHGQSEYYNPRHPLSYDSIWARHGGLIVSKNGPHYAQDAWALGNELGVIASTDDHSGRPGYPTKGLAAVYAGTLTRHSIFDGLRKKRTYGTTGQRIILDFSINQQMMGSKIHVPLNEYPQLYLMCAGTDEIEFVEILKWKFDKVQYDVSGHSIYEIVKHYEVRSDRFDTTFIDSTYDASSLYYIRLKQTRDAYENALGGATRQVWAWSSPIWVTTTLIDLPDIDVPKQIYLSQNYPNPFNPITKIIYGIPLETHVRLTVYDMLGREVQRLVDAIQRGGNYSIEFNSRNLSTGVYLYALRVGNQVVARKMVVIN